MPGLVSVYPFYVHAVYSFKNLLIKTDASPQTMDIWIFAAMGLAILTSSNCGKQYRYRPKYCFK